MSKPVNLNRYRKDKARGEARARGDENAAKFGRTKAAKVRDRDAAIRVARHLDGHKTQE